MARRTTHQGERIIAADNGFGWRKERSSLLSSAEYLYTTTIFGVPYRLEKFKDSLERTNGWCLYSYEDARPRRFYAEYVEPLLLPAIDKASEMIDEADLRGPGYERKDA